MIARPAYSQRAALSAVPQSALLLLHGLLAGTALAGTALAAAAPSQHPGGLLRPPASSDSGPRWGVRAVSPPPPTTRLISVGADPPPSRLLPATEAAEAASAVVQPRDGQQLAVAPTPRPYRLRPSLGGGKPTGYVGGWGDYFISGTAGTPGRLRENNQPDGSVNAGFAIGDPVKAIGVDLYWGTGSINNFNANGGFGISAGRLLVNRWNLQVAAAGGVIDVFQYGDEPGRRISSPYGAVTVAVPLRPRDPVFKQVLQVSVGGGGEGFAEIDTNFQTGSGGFFAAAGLEVLPNLGLSAGVSNRSTVVNVSYIPFRNLPIFVNLTAADVFDTTPYGPIGLLTVGWSDNWRSGFFNANP